MLLKSRNSTGTWWRVFSTRSMVCITYSLTFFFTISYFVFVFATYGAASSAFKTLPNSKLKSITLSSIDLIMEDTEGMLIERVPDTETHTFIQVYLKSKFSGKWTIETDTFESDTPLGKKKFTNIIATHNSCPNCDFLVLAAHYDSKFFNEFKFVAATDSAVPCAILIDIGRSIENLLDSKKQSMGEPREKLGLKIIFFDGEEAFINWTDDDSLYGSRHLAEKWENDKNADGETLISKINAFVLLDLLGAAKPTFYKFASTPSYLFEHILDVENRLQKKNVLGSLGPFFSTRSVNQAVQDDHIPFEKRGVKVLHVIPLPFPSTWHTHSDDRASIDPPTIDALAKIFKVFVAEHLEV